MLLPPELLPPEAAPLLALFAAEFTAPTAARFHTLFAAALLTTGRRTVAGVLRTLRHLAPGHVTAYRRVLSRAEWSGLALGCALARLVVARLPADAAVLLVGDDTVDGHTGRTVYGKGRHRDPTRSSHAYTAWRYGHKWVVLVAPDRIGLPSPPRFPYLSTPLPILPGDRRGTRRHDRTSTRPPRGDDRLAEVVARVGPPGRDRPPRVRPRAQRRHRRAPRVRAAHRRHLAAALGGPLRPTRPRRVPRQAGRTPPRHRSRPRRRPAARAAGPDHPRAGRRDPRGGLRAARKVGRPPVALGAREPGRRGRDPRHPRRRLRPPRRAFFKRRRPSGRTAVRTGSTPRIRTPPSSGGRSGTCATRTRGHRSA